MFIYSDPSRGSSFGYTFDGWDPDEAVFLYTGEGADGDQQMTGGNKSLRDHAAEGRTVRLFVADGFVSGSTRNHLYLGEFALDGDLPFTIEQAPDRSGSMRHVFVFRLVPQGEFVTRPVDRSEVVDQAAAARVRLVGLEAHRVTAVPVQASQARTAQRRESELVARYLAYRGPGVKFSRFEVVPPGHFKPLLTDIYDVAANRLFEVKATAGRDAVRMAVGQLLDYRRHIDVPGLALGVLVPERPSADLLDFLRSVGAVCSWERADGTFQTDDGASAI